MRFDISRFLISKLQDFAKVQNKSIQVKRNLTTKIFAFRQEMLNYSNRPVEKRIGFTWFVIRETFVISLTCSIINNKLYLGLSAFLVKPQLNVSTPWYYTLLTVSTMQSPQ